MADPFVFDSALSNPGGTGSTITVALSTHAVDDILLIFLPKTGNAAWTVPAGYSAIDQRSVGTSSNGVHGSWFARKIVSGDTLPLADPVCTLGATVTRFAACLTIRNADLEGIFVLPEYGARGFATGTANPVRPPPSVTTLAPGMLVIHGYGQRAATNAPDPSGYTQDEEAIISGTLVMNVAHKTVTDQNTVLSNQDASPTSGARWVAGILCIPSADYPYYRSGTQALTASGTSVTGTLPTGTSSSDWRTNKDCVIATVEAAGTPTISPQVGGDWTEITGQAGTTSGNGSTIRRYFALYDGSLNLQFNRSTSGEIAACLTTYRNTDQTDPIGNTNTRQNASSTTSTWDALTRIASKVTVQATCIADGTPTFTAPSGWTERMDGNGIVCADQIYNAIGSSASASFTLSAASPTLVTLLEIKGVASLTPIVVTPSTVSLSLTSFAPTISVTDNVTVIPTTTALLSTGLAPSIRFTTRVTPTTVNLSLTTFAPKFAATVTPTTASLSLASFAPALRFVTLASPANASLTLTTFAPTIALTDHVTVIPSTRSVVLSRFAPSIQPPPIIFLDPGGDAVQAIGYFNAVGANGGGISFDTSQKFIGIGSYKFDSGADLATWVRVDGILSAGRRISFRFRFDSTHTTVRVIAILIAQITLSAGPSPVLQVSDPEGNTDSGTTVLSVDTWYRISVSTSGVPDRLDVKLYLDGVEEASSLITDTGGSLPLDFSYGWVTQPGASKICWFDQIYVDEGGDLTDPGDILTTAKLPASVNDNSFDTTGGTGAVNERPLSETNYRQHANTSQVSQNYTLQTAAAGDVNISGDSLVGYMGWVWAKKSEAGGAHSLTLNGNDHPITLTTSPARHQVGITSGNYPSNVAGIGLVSGGTTADTFLYECGAVIAFTLSESNDITVTPATIALTVSSFAPSLRLDLVPGTHSLTLSSFAPVIESRVTPNHTPLTLTTFSPSVVFGTNVVPSTAVLSLTGFAAALTEGLTPSTASLTVTEFAPSLSSSVTPETEQLVTTAFAPSLQLTITPSFAALPLSTFAPTVNVEAGVTVVPGSASLTLTTFAPVIGQSVTAMPDPASLVIGSFAPSLSLQLTPATASLITATFAASLSANLIPLTGSLTLGSFAPTVIATGADVTLEPSVFSLVLVTHAPHIRRFRFHGQENIGRENRTIAISSERNRLEISLDNRVL